MSHVNMKPCSKALQASEGHSTAPNRRCFEGVEVQAAAADHQPGFAVRLQNATLAAEQWVCRLLHQLGGWGKGRLADAALFLGQNECCSSSAQGSLFRSSH